MCRVFRELLCTGAIIILPNLKLKTGSYKVQRISIFRNRLGYFILIFTLNIASRVITNEKKLNKLKQLIIFDIYKVIKDTVARLGFEPKLTVHETVVLTNYTISLFIFILS